MSKDKKFDIGKIDRNMQTKQADADGLVWHAPYEKPFKLVGFYWFAQEKIYRRFPVTPDPELPPGVESLAWHTAGGQVKFQTDSKRICVKAKLRASCGMHHMPSTGQSGFDLYVGKPQHETFFGVTVFSDNDTEFTCELLTVKERQKRNYTINFPLYNGVEEMFIGLEDGCGIEAPLPYEDDRPTIVYGTSITQGGCASRPGGCYSNILSRYLNRPFLNFGFSGSGRGEPEVAQHLSRINDPAMFILDYEANCFDVDRFKNTLPGFIDILREKHPVTPILLVSKIRFGKEALDGGNVAEQIGHRRVYRDECKAIYHAEMEKRIAAGDKNIWFLDGSDFLGDDYHECTVDGVHPTDLGFFRMAKSMAPTIEKILEQR